MTGKTMQRALRSVAADPSGIAALEFALIAPVFLFTVFGIIDLGQMAYGQAVLNGAAQTAARASSLENANTTTADAVVTSIVSPVLPGATVISSRTNYVEFSDIGRKEPHTDSNGNGSCDNREPYVDQNGNNRFDTDVGEDGNGGANDVVVYTVTATYTPVIAMPFLPASWNRLKITSTALRKNQPFATQVAYNTVTRTC